MRGFLWAFENKRPPACRIDRILLVWHTRPIHYVCDGGRYCFMERMKLGVKTRTADGGAEALRAEGKIPGILYGGGRAESTSVAIDRGAFLKLRKIISKSTVFDVDVDGDVVPVLMGQIQFDPISDEPIHVDLRQLDMTKPVKASIKFHFVGEAPAVKAGGMLVINRESVHVKAMPSALVDFIDIDVSLLATFDQSIHMDDIVFPEGIEVTEDLRTALVVVQPPRTVETFTEGPSEAEAVAAVADSGKVKKEGEGDEGASSKDES